MNLTVNRTLAKILGLEEGLVYQYLVDNMDRNKELNISYLQLTKSIDLLTINAIKKAILNLHDSNIIDNSYDVEGNKVITIKEIIE